ncbi:MAG TPA: carboxypeptidase M32 [candidate division Zixibacteria bacterium]|mgnify:CR=1 FL=1|nr:carboxypeptidase M32 [candidate division Zixibacteria bacterium]MDD4917753.1 carboxypeptidase M32 [candidate division Zixibacteria bacterium]MDM7973118.1 carboxypeptidase M32 [candidate division Zixibacteria bacterium]HOD67582.1 carboxypeptidase M32 [candidate division Zixibacteria bacterium]HOZ07281.1 carboxypeptidase M32 [candidate division Zixibacteria bacterium]
MTAREAYTRLKARMKEIAVIESTGGVLYWDRKSYMPPKGIAHRSEQLAQLTRLSHDWFTAPEVGDWLAAVEQSDLVRDPASEAAVNVREWRRLRDREEKLPAAFVEQFARTTALAGQVWAEARKKSNFALFEPHLGGIVELVRRKADYYGYTAEKYDALLEGYEPGARTAEVERAFAGLRTDLVELVEKIADAPRRPDIGVLKRPWDVDKQRTFSRMLAAQIGYDFGAGRIDETVHPCCNDLGPLDVRILTRFYAEDLAEGLTGTIHEAGHAFYTQSQRGSEHWGTPMGMTPSLAIHESQSRTWENIVGRSRHFWTYFFPQLRALFPEETRDITLDDFYAAMNYVAPSYIRVEADEATYNLHIMLRFELERAIVEGDLAVKDIPGEWNSRFRQYLGLAVDTDAHGCLQDVHWSDGSFGYFPTYALGNLYAAQFWSRAKADLPGLMEDFAAGQFDRLMTWLSENIHRQGFKVYPNELCRRLTGSDLSHRPLLDYLYAKYEEIYGIRRN